MDVALEFRRCLVDLDVVGVRKLWAHVSPNMPAPATDADALVALHIARTAADSVPVGLRFYSHAWLRDHDLPSQLPDHLKPRADRLYPRIVEAVGISVNFTSSLLKPAAVLVRRAMEIAVEDAFANGDTDPAFVSARMTEARNREMGALFGGLVARIS